MAGACSENLFNNRVLLEKGMFYAVLQASLSNWDNIATVKCRKTLSSNIIARICLLLIMVTIYLEEIVVTDDH